MPSLADLLVGLLRHHDVEAAALEERRPEGQPLVGVHRPRDADGAPGSAGAAAQQQAGVFGFGHVREHEGVAELDQVADDGLLVDLGPLAVPVGALVAPVGLLVADGELADVALVGAALAGELADGVVDLVEVPAAEPGGGARGRHLLAGQQRHADSADDAVVRRHDDVLVEDHAERGRHRVVVGGAALEVDGVADVSTADQAVEVVVGDGVRQPGHEILLVSTPLEVGVDVALHEDGAALAEAHGRFRRQGQVGELPDDLDAQLLGLLLEERARAGGAGLVHGEVDHDAVLQADELGVLSADLEDGVGHPVDQLAADEGRAGLVSGDLVVDGVGADELADQLAPGAGGGHAQDVEARAHLVPDLGQTAVDHLDGAALGLDVDLFDHLAGFVQDHQVGGDAADVDAQVGADLLVARGELVRLDPVAQQDDPVHGQRVAAAVAVGLTFRQAVGVDGDHLDAGALVGYGEGAADGAHPRIVARG